MKILIACEESQAVTKEFRKLGHEAYSCDIEPCSGGHPEWHLQQGVIPLLKEQWDLMIAHPPCTYLSNSGVSWLYRKEGRWQQMVDGALFFKTLLDADIPRIAIENPIMHKYAKEIIGRGQDQVIQPWMFGHPEQKATCLWLKNLPKLQPTENVKHKLKTLPDSERQKLHWLPPGPDRAKLRSKTFPGIARAMARQWAEV